jgi:hypothetical protein
MSLGVCIPAQCSPELIEQMADTVLGMINATTSKGYKQENNCHVKDELHFNAIDWFAM